MRSIPFVVDDLMEKIQKISFSPIDPGSDEFCWVLAKNGVFLVDSKCIKHQLNLSSTIRPFGKIPLKTKVFARFSSTWCYSY
jgi:hypothetical protein